VHRGPDTGDGGARSGSGEYNVDMFAHTPGHPEHVFELLKLLAKYSDHDATFPEKSKVLLLTHLPALLKLKEFR